MGRRVWAEGAPRTAATRQRTTAVFVALAVLSTTFLMGTAPAAGAAADPVPHCRIRGPQLEPEVLASLVEQQRALHLATDFRPDSLYNDEFGTEEFEVPTDLRLFWDAPIAMDRIEPVQAYGLRVHPITGRLKFHNGLDFAVGRGTPIRALADGTLAVAGGRGGYGNTIVIDHGGGFTTLYAHLSGFAVEVGTPIEAGQVIGYVGSTGLSTGPHLHIETRLGGVPVDPRWFIPVLESPPLTTSRHVVGEPETVAPQRVAEFQIERLYLLAFERRSDPAAVAYWVSRCRHGVPLSEIAELFVASTEFQDQFGEREPVLGATDRDMIEQLLARAGIAGPEADRLRDEWIWLLENGVPRGRLLAEVSESTDHVSSASVRLTQESVRRLYRAVLGREPDPLGAYYWTERSTNGESLRRLAEVMGNSPEYLERFGQTSTEEFVERVYELVFDRGPDAEGLEFWTARADETDRWTVLVGFSESPEGRLLLSK